MKKIVSTVLVCVMLLSCVLVLASCAKTLSGEYVNETTVFGVTTTTSYEFEGSNVTIKTSVSGFSYEYDGEYAIDGDTITFTFGDEDAEKYSGEVSFNEGSDNDGAYIELDGTKYYKK